MSEPVKLPTKDIETVSQLQTGGTPVPVIEFLGTDKDGNKVTIEGQAIGYGDINKADKIVRVTTDVAQKTLQKLVDEDKHDTKWKLVVRSISDDVGNTAASLTWDFTINPAGAVENNEFRIAVDASKNVVGVTGVIAADKDVVKVRFTSAIQYTGKVENAINIYNYLLDNENLPKGTSIDVDQTTKETKDKVDYYKGITITLPAGTLSADNSNVLTVSKNLKSASGVKLTGDYKVEFKATGGTKVVDKSAIDKANTAKTDVEISVDGSELATTVKWVTQAVSDALDAATALDAAVGIYNAAKTNGTKP